MAGEVGGAVEQRLGIVEVLPEVERLAVRPRARRAGAELLARAEDARERLAAWPGGGMKRRG